MQVAVHLQAAGERALSKSVLDEMAARHPALRHLQGFDVGGRSLLNRNHAAAYRFSHYSTQEFLVVRALVEGLLDLRTGLLSLNPRARDWQRQAVPMLASGQRLRLTDQMLAFLIDTDAALVLDQRTFDFGDLRPAGRAGLAIRARLPDGTPAPVTQYLPPRPGAAGRRRPPQPVEIADGFWLGRYPVTFDEYDALCAGTGRAPPDDNGWGRGTRPVINVSFEDAVAYCDWLSGQTGEAYRPPTEVEWEYACRAGSRTLYSFGDSENDLDAHAWYDRNAGGRTHPVGEKRPNAWGLYDMHGNVWEWCDSLYDQSGADAPRVLRGGRSTTGPRSCAPRTGSGTFPSTGSATSAFAASWPRSASLDPLIL